MPIHADAPRQARASHVTAASIAMSRVISRRQLRTSGLARRVKRDTRRTSITRGLRPDLRTRADARQRFCRVLGEMRSTRARSGSSRTVTARRRPARYQHNASLACPGSVSENRVQREI